MRTHWIVVASAALYAILIASPVGARKPSADSRGNTRGPALKVQVDKSHALDEHRMEIRMSRPPGKIEISVTNENGIVIAEHEHDFTGRSAGASLGVGWDQPPDQPIGSIVLRMYDRDGHYVHQEYSAWYVPIPHEDVNFRTDSAEIDLPEIPKLEEAFAKVQEILSKDKAREHKNLTLYVAGHTDTVGSAGYNLRLSQARAQSLARWFRQRGVRIPIAFEGFGETALRVQTPDETDEPRNRRADYIIADEPPPMKSTGFRPGWKLIN
jgi:outer membrane protein OmpA-like peptidoglycan-associated protein